MRKELKDMSQELEKLTAYFTTHPSPHHIIPVLLAPVLDVRKPCSDIETQSLTGTLEIFITLGNFGDEHQTENSKVATGCPFVFSSLASGYLGSWSSSLVTVLRLPIAS